MGLLYLHSKIKSNNMTDFINPSMGYSPKDLNFGENGRQKLIKGINQIAHAVKSTLGPMGNTVLIESYQHTSSITVTKDGVTVAKAVELLDPIENMAVRIMKEAAERTATSAGDGTTTAIVLTEELIREGMVKFASHPKINKTEVFKHLVELTAGVVEELKSKSKTLTPEMLLGVATISANNDSRIGEIISELYYSVGVNNGIVTVEKSQSTETYSESTKGLQFDRGYSSNLFINDHSKDQCVFDDVMVLLTDIEINSVLQIENILKPIIQENKKLLIISPCSQNMLNTLVANKMKNNLKVCVVSPPSFGYRQNELMQDIALAVGANYFSEKTGDDLSIMNYADLGHANKVIIDEKKTIIIRSDVRSDAEKIQERLDQLWDAYNKTTKMADKNFLKERIGSLSGGVGVIHVGGNTDLEQKELYDRVDDAVCAVRSALEEGILPGAGKALFHLANNPFFNTDDSSIANERLVAWDILKAGMQAPLTQILANAGICVTDVYNGKEPFGEGYNLKTNTKAGLIEMGVIDPLKVTRSALQNAVSVAVTILSTNAIITMARSYETK
jgi:chaperonin GroEL